MVVALLNSSFPALNEYADITIKGLVDTDDAILTTTDRTNSLREKYYDGKADDVQAMKAMMKKVSAGN